jgi:hypothetical protein
MRSTSDIIKERFSILDRLTYTSENVQDPVCEKEVTRRGSFRGGAEYRGDPIASYMSVVIFYS